MKPQWQRAKILLNESFPELVGREVWVRIEQPFISNSVSIKTGRPTAPDLCREVAIDSGHAGKTVMQASKLECLARDENDFAEDVSFVRWDDFRANSPL